MGPQFSGNLKYTTGQFKKKYNTDEKPYLYKDDIKFGKNFCFYSKCHKIHFLKLHPKYNLTRPGEQAIKQGL